MRKACCYLVTLLFFLAAFAIGKSSFAFLCVGPADSSCLQCHAAEGGGTSGSNSYPDGYLHSSHVEFDCGSCHCAADDTCGSHAETICCTSCHNGCLEVESHVTTHSTDCNACHYNPATFDHDADGVADCLDNCPSDPNSGQEDNYPPGGNGIGDACECEGDFDCDGDVDADDVSTFLADFGRNTYNNPCTADNPCYGDFEQDEDVDADDVTKFLEDFGRNTYNNPCPACNRPIGVLFAVHGGTDTHHEQYLWDAGLQQFSYDPNHSVYKLAIWNSGWWDFVMKAESSIKFMGKYDFEYPQIGGTDPFSDLTEGQLSDMESELDTNPYDMDFEIDWVGWMCGDCVDHYPYPRFIYYGPDGLPDPDGDYEDCRYCGEDEPGGPWIGCNPDRYDVDGPVERLLKKGVYRIIIVDLTVGGVRFSKTYDVVQMTKRVLDDWETEHGVSIPLTWVNDYSNLMERSFPIEPEGWTRTLGLPDVDSEVLKNGRPNPVAADPDLAALYTQAIEDGWGGASDNATGVIILNHAIHSDNEVFDPKMDDTIVLNENIKSQLLANHPTIDPDNIIGARMGIKEENPDAEHTLEERTRFMRGESLGHQYLYETDKVFPSGGSDPRGQYHCWGYTYWDALDYLKNRGVEHIVIGFTQIITNSVLDMVEIPNQIGKEIGKKNWLKWGTWDYTSYPTAGHPFADYWGNWVYTECGEWELQFAGGTEEIAAGGMNPTTLDNQAMLLGNTSGATGVIKQVIVESGSWNTNDAAGRIILKELAGSFTDGELIYDTKGTPGSALTNGSEAQTISSECCFIMGGCPDDGLGLPRPYPPPRLTALPDRRHDMDPSLAYEVSEYGHIGYDPLSGDPEPDNPVQNQYTGTWEMYAPPNDDPGVGQLLAKHVLSSVVNPMVYITNGNLEGITTGGSVTFEAHASGGKPAYTYEWSINKDDSGWSVVSGETSSTWTWNPVSGDEGSYDIQCKATDSLYRFGNVTFEDFVVSAP